jgi:carotenoid cleavage dioxygenase-like enzyme
VFPLVAVSLPLNRAHEFGITKNYSIFFDLAVIFDAKGMVSSAPSLTFFFSFFLWLHFFLPFFFFLLLFFFFANSQPLQWQVKDGGMGFRYDKEHKCRIGVLPKKAKSAEGSSCFVSFLF